MSAAGLAQVACAVALSLVAAWAAETFPESERCEDRGALAGRVREAHLRWFSGERIRDRDADALADAAAALGCP